MRLLVASSESPYPAHSVRAANVVIFEMVAALARQAGVHVGLLVVHRARADPPTENMRQGADELRRLGVEVLAPIALGDMPTSARRSAPARVLRPRLSDHVPELAHAPLLQAAIDRFAPDVVIVPWSEWLTAVLSVIPLPKFAYYGNPEPKARRAQLELRRRAREVGKLHASYDEYRIGQFERIHLASMNEFRWLGDVAANDAAYYTSRGHPNAFYTRNMWIEPRRQWRPARPADGVARFVANVGQLRATANTYGLEYLGVELLPAMRRAFGSRRFELHLFGAAMPHPRITSLIRQPEFVIRGFVDDIDQEIVNANAFLCVNNATPYKVGHTRYLHAWSLGGCVVAHRDASLSMPEIVAGENALLGGDASEIADYLSRVASDAALRDRIGAAGRATFTSDFTAGKVVPQLLDRIRDGPGA